VDSGVAGDYDREVVASNVPLACIAYWHGHPYRHGMPWPNPDVKPVDELIQAD